MKVVVAMGRSVGLGALLVALVAGSAWADDNGVGLSLDGTHWTNHLTTPLFAEPKLWVPGDQATATLFLRHFEPGVSKATARVAFCNRDAGAGPGTGPFPFEVKVRYDNGEWQDAGELFQTGIASGHAAKLDIQVTLPDDSRNPTEARSWPVDVEVMMMEQAGSSAAPSPTPSACASRGTPSPSPTVPGGPGDSANPTGSPGGPGAPGGIGAAGTGQGRGRLPFTGSSTLVVAGLAAAAVGAGIGLVSRRRKASHHESH